MNDTVSALPFYIITSNATSRILPFTCYLYNKYWNKDGRQEFVVLTQSQPTSQLPANFRCISFTKHNPISEWTREVYDCITRHSVSPFFFLTLDDYLPNQFCKPEILHHLLAYAQTHERVGRVALSHIDLEKFDVVESSAAYDLVRLHQDTVYRISCQTSLWNRQYFEQFFNRNWSPWQLELEGSKLAKSDGWEIIGTNRDWAFSWQEESALSGRWPGKVNILGVHPEDVAYGIEQGWLKPETLQYGIWYECRIPFVSRMQTLSKKLTRIPQFSDIGYNFTWAKIRPFVRRKTLRRLLNRYQALYPMG